MLKKIKEMNPIIVLASVAFAGIFVLLLLAASIFGIYKMTLGNTDIFEEKFVVQEPQPDYHEFDIRSHQIAQQQMELMQKLMEQQQLEMKKMQSQYFAPGMTSMIPGQSMNIIDTSFSASPGLQVKEMPDKYIVTLGQPGNNFDENSIDINCHKNRLDIKITQKTKGQNGYSSSNMYQSMTLGEPVDVSRIKKETIGDKYIITLPKLTDKDNSKKASGSMAQHRSII